MHDAELLAATRPIVGPSVSVVSLKNGTPAASPTQKSAVSPATPVVEATAEIEPSDDEEQEPGHSTEDDGRAMAKDGDDRSRKRSAIESITQRYTSRGIPEPVISRCLSSLDDALSSLVVRV